MFSCIKLCVCTKLAWTDIQSAALTHISDLCDNCIGEIQKVLGNFKRY